MVGWAIGRNHWKKEDRRWEGWREKWRGGEGFFGITSVPVNFFFFYHAQSMSNVLFMSVPLFLMCNNNDPKIHFFEVLGFLIWCTAFYLENKADVQLTRFKMNKENRGKTMNQGLWAYSRHPNYFFEWCLWVSYMVMALPSAHQTWHYILLGFLPYLAYFFLVHFTGVPMAEKCSLKNRGEEYKKYQETTNMFFPWFPRTKVASA
jgi:steroid 5-alpha reductase family enzyme